MKEVVFHNVSVLSCIVRVSVLWIAKLHFPTLCLFFVQVLASVLMCLLDWLMVIPVSKLLSKTNEDENVSVLTRVFQVKIHPLRDWERCAILTRSESLQDWARKNSHEWRRSVYRLWLVTNCARKFKTWSAAKEALQDWAREILTVDSDPRTVSDWLPFAPENSKPDLQPIRCCRRFFLQFCYHYSWEEL